MSEDRFHIDIHGKPAPCKAKQNCPRGGDSEHFPTVEEAQQYADKKNEENVILELEKVSDTVEEISRDFLEKSSVNLSKEEKLNILKEMDNNDFNIERQVFYNLRNSNELRDIITPEKYLEYKKHFENAEQDLSNYNQIQEELKSLSINKDDTWFNKVEEGRQTMYSHIKNRRLYKDLRTQEIKDKEEIPEEYNSHTDPNNPYNFHPDVDNKTRWQYVQVISSYSGLNKEEIEKEIQEKILQKELTETEAYRELFSEVPLRNDKPIVSIDLETTGFRGEESLGTWDNGERSEILEVGYIVKYPDGSIKKKSTLYSSDDKLTNLVGTGFEDVHKITVDDVKDKSRLIDNLVDQEELYNDLKGSVMIAHNANFEKNRLTHSVRGIGQLFDNKEIEILDTMHVSKFYMPNNERNTNQSFVQNTGGQYVGGHRAYQDAWMSFNALLRLKCENEIELDNEFNIT